MQLVDSLNPIKQNRQLVPRIPNQSLLSPPSPTVSCLQPSTPSSNGCFQAPAQSGCPSSLLASGGACLPLSIQGAAGQLNSAVLPSAQIDHLYRHQNPSEFSSWSGYPASPRPPGTGRWMSSWRSYVRTCS